MAVIHLLEGPVGSGKSTLGLKLGEQYQAPVFVLDEWMSRLFSPDRPPANVMVWYMERKNRCLEVIWKTAVDVLATGSDVVLELGLIRRDDRSAFCERVDSAGHRLEVYVLDADRQVRRDRVRKRNQEQSKTYFMEVPEEVFDLANEYWQDVESGEFAGHGLQFIDT